MKTKLIIAGLAAIALCAGCTSLTTPQGWKYNSSIFRKQISEMSVTGNTNGNYSLRIKGYQSDADKLYDLLNEAIKRFPAQP